MFIQKFKVGENDVAYLKTGNASPSGFSVNPGDIIGHPKTATDTALGHLDSIDRVLKFEIEETKKPGESEKKETGKSEKKEPGKKVEPEKKEPEKEKKKAAISDIIRKYGLMLSSLNKE